MLIKLFNIDNVPLANRKRYIVASKLLEIYRYHEHSSPSSEDLLKRINKIRHDPRELEKFLMENLIESKQQELLDN